MNTPILDMLKEYSKKDILRLHMPGHKGLLNEFDITEVEGADDLFNPDGIIKESEENAGKIFGADSFYSTEGSSLSIRAMVYLTALYAKSKGEEPLILAARNCHKSFISALALTGVSAEWLIPEGEGSYLSCPLTGEEVRRAIRKRKPTAVYLTSPDYLGRLADVKAIAEVCHGEGVLLLVDNAHGAYLKFLSPSLHPIDLGADVCCDSAHKTLRVLGGGAYLHLSRSAPQIYKERAKEAMALFASTSPSYIILSSLDGVNPELEKDFPAVLSTFVDNIACFGEKIQNLGYSNASQEPLKITLEAGAYGYTGYQLAEQLSKAGIVVEFYDRDYLVMMLSPYMSEQELTHLYHTLSSVPKKKPIEKKVFSYALPKARLTPREAMLSLSEKVNVEKSIGRTLAAITVGCPPAVPIIVSGEIIDKQTVEVAKYYGIKSFSVTLD